MRHKLNKIVLEGIHLRIKSVKEQSERDLLLLEQVNLEDKLKANKLLLEKRNLTSKEIGQKKKSGDAVDSLITEMQLISRDLKILESEISAKLELIETQLAKHSQLTQTPEENTLVEHTPAHFVSSPDKNTLEHSGLTVEVASNGIEWDEYVASHTEATVYHQFAWQGLISKCFGHKCHYLVAKDNSKTISGIIPMVNLKSRFFGNFLVSMPYFNYGGPLTNHTKISDFLLNASSKLAMELGCAYTEIRECHAREHWPSKSDKVSMIFVLPDSPDKLDRILGSKIRSQVKQPIQKGASVSTGGKELLDLFYSVFSENMRDLGTPVYPKYFFDEILKAFPDDTFITVVSINSRPVAAAFLIGYRDKLEVPWASSLRKANHLSVNMLLYRTLLSEALKRDYKYFDFGRSTVNSPTYKFKKQWGAKEHPLYWHYWLRDAESLPSLNPDNPKFQIAIKTWQKLPVWFTNVLGPHIVKNLP